MPMIENKEDLGKIVKASEKWQQILEERKTRPPFQAKTGLPTIDMCLKRLKRGHFIVLSGPRKAGKTSLALTFTKSFIEQGLKCLWFPFEMGHEDILERFDKLFSKNFDFFTPNELVDKDVEWVRTKVIEAQDKDGVDVIFIDHLDQLRDRKLLMKNVNMNMSSYIGGIVQSVQSLGKERNVIVVLLCHITKEKRGRNEVPDSDDIADTRHIMDLADFILMAMRAKPLRKNSLEVYDGNKAIIGVVENRHGGITKNFPAELIDEFFYEIDTLNNKPIETELKEEIMVNPSIFD